MDKEIGMWKAKIYYYLILLGMIHSLFVEVWFCLLFMHWCG